MSNIFLSASFLFLSAEEAGCLNEEGDEILDSCDGEVHGMRPASFVSNIAVVSGVLSALFMPVFGAMIDYTDHRRTVGALSAFLMMLIQATQIGTVSATWFPMAILQAFAGFLFQIQVLAALAYLPDIARLVGQGTMTKCASIRIMYASCLQVFGK
jgi:MFS-type transporter involved in bile tolerance (Atg22 family)